MEIITQQAIPINDSSDPGQARRAALLLAEKLGFDSTRSGEVGIIVTECAQNILAHAKSGEIVLKPWKNEQQRGIEIFALDKGPGMADIEQSMQDGHSTAGTPGNGLGAIRRLATSFHVYSRPGKGSVLYASVRVGQESKTEGRLKDGYVCVPVAGETACGDAVAIVHSRGRSMFIVADGLGHGPGAAEASEAAVEAFHKNVNGTPVDILNEAQGLLKSTRGAAVAIAEVNTDSGTVNYAGVGNISGQIVNSSGRRSMISHNGTVGHTLHKVQQFAYPWTPDSTLVMHSDGITSSWDFAPYPGLQIAHPEIMAAVMYRDFCRKRDDSTFMVARLEQS